MSSLLERAKAGELLTPEELAELLKKPVAWVYEKRRPRCPNPIPAIPMGRGSLRFEWAEVFAWLKDCAAKDAETLMAKRNRRTKTRKKRLTDADRRELLEMAQDARAFFAGVARDEDGVLMSDPNQE